jgi:hypothetical protein
MSRQVISAFKILPPFEVIDYPKTIEVKTMTPLGMELIVSVPILLLPSESEFITEAQQAIHRAADAVAMETAISVKLVTPEQLDAIKNLELKVEDLDTINK